MRSAWLVLVVAVAARAARHTFYRALPGAEAGAGGGGRRMFGGRAAALQEWGAVCALLDRYWAARCSGAVVAPRWAVTAAHCVSPRLAYVQYNTRRPHGAARASAAPVHALYTHPGYRVVEEDEGRGPDVTLLHHDVGLVRTRADMRLDVPPPLAFLAAALRYDLSRLADEPVDVLGFGRTEAEPQGEQLYATRLVVARCERGAWLHCACGRAGERAGARGVCAGDSGGPVLYRGAQVAVTSMGPVECGAGGQAAGGAALTSVFTALHPYVALLNATMRESDAALAAAELSAAPPPRAPRAALLACLCWRAAVSL